MCSTPWTTFRRRCGRHSTALVGRPEKHSQTSGELFVPISTVHQPAQVGRYRPPGPDRPPSACSAPIRRPSAAWRRSAPLSSSTCTSRRVPLGVVRVVDDPEPRPGPDVVAHLVNGSPDSAGAAVRRLNGFDVVVVQHEYGIYGGPDGVDVLADRRCADGADDHRAAHRPPGSDGAQRHILLRLLAAADVVVTMTQTASRRLVASYGADPAQVVVIPHGAVDHGHAAPGGAPTRRPPARPHLGIDRAGEGHRVGDRRHGRGCATCSRATW